MELAPNLEAVRVSDRTQHLEWSPSQVGRQHGVETDCSLLLAVGVALERSKGRSCFTTVQVLLEHGVLDHHKRFEAEGPITPHLHLLLHVFWLKDIRLSHKLALFPATASRRRRR